MLTCESLELRNFARYETFAPDTVRGHLPCRIVTVRNCSNREARQFGGTLRQERSQVTQLPRMASECIRLLILTVHDIVMRFPAGDETPDDKVRAKMFTSRAISICG